MPYTKKAVKIQQDGSGLIDCACGAQLKVDYASGDNYNPCTCGFVYTSTGWIVNSGLISEALGTCDLREINSYPHNGAEPHPYHWYCSRWTPIESRPEDCQKWTPQTARMQKGGTIGT